MLDRRGGKLTCQNQLDSSNCFDTVSAGTNLIHDFTAVAFSVKLAFFREKRLFP